jgi:hypothetical protein
LHFELSLEVDTVGNPALLRYLPEESVQEPSEDLGAVLVAIGAVA